MATAAELITDSLGELLVSASEQSVQPEEMQAGIRYLNRMMSELAVQGMSLGFTIIVNPADVVTVPDGVQGAVVSLLALKLAPQYDAPITGSLIQAAKDGKNAILNLTISRKSTQMPSTMPVGSGNEGYLNGNLNTRHFYPGIDTDTIDDENGRNIQQETNT